MSASSDLTQTELKKMNSLAKVQHCGIIVIVFDCFASWPIVANMKQAVRMVSRALR